MTDEEIREDYRAITKTFDQVIKAERDEYNKITEEQRLEQEKADRKYAEDEFWKRRKNQPYKEDNSVNLYEDGSWKTKDLSSEEEVREKLRTFKKKFKDKEDKINKDKHYGLFDKEGNLKE